MHRVNTGSCQKAGHKTQKEARAGEGLGGAVPASHDLDDVVEDLPRLRLSGKPVARTYGLLWLNYGRCLSHGLFWGIVASYFRI